MCDPASASTILWALSLMPGNRYILVGVISASFIIYAVTRHRPSYQLGQLEDAIRVAEKILKYAKANCERKHVELVDGTHCLLKVKLSVSKIRTRLLETRGIRTGVGYLRNVRQIIQSINQCAKEVKQIQTSTLLIIEAERQRELSEEIRDSHEILDTFVSSFTRRAQAVTRRDFAMPTSYISPESSMV
ncbi:hypothetical protein MVEN_00960500 [Mycena venus]|uniref:Uncharacterized protein n=1 Tax=Mycena venus TaxID=2733690 RepID=A0A8H6YD36_9AGAR|nr:hypothetical protein MVEN_00960500 [Mycena venus]